MTQQRPSLILITIDCLRADHVGFLGYHQATTPFLDFLAQDSVVFRNVTATGSPTYYSFPAIMSSRYPLALGRDLIGLAPQQETLASVLKDNGYKTAAFIAANPYLSRRFGYHRGFDAFGDFLDEPLEPTADAESLNGHKPSRANEMLRKVSQMWTPSAAVYDELYFRYCQRLSARGQESLDSLRRFPSADVLIGHAIAWLKLNSGRPFFQWLHFMDPHAPYYPKRQALEQLGNGSISPRHAKYLNSFWARADVNTKRLHKKRDEIMTLYDAGIRWVDRQVQRLAETLVDLNMWNHCTMAVTADHGEEFLDHGGRFHAPLMLHQELVHVPLLLHGSGFKPQVMDQPIGLIDLAPTLLDHLQVSVPPSFRGHSCWSHLQTNGTWDWPVVSECVRGCTNPYRESDRIGPRILAVRKGRFKLVVDFSAGIERLFDLERDPCEQAPSPPDAERAIRRDLLECARRHVAESHQSRDFNHRFDSKSRDLGLEWAHSRATTTN